MTVTNQKSGTNVHEIADGIYRINTPVDLGGGNKFSFPRIQGADVCGIVVDVGKTFWESSEFLPVPSDLLLIPSESARLLPSTPQVRDRLPSR